MRTKKISKSYRIGLLVFCLALVFADWLLKHYFTLVGKIVWNGGGVFGTAPSVFWIPITGLLILSIAWYWFKAAEKLLLLGLVFLLAGGVGNLGDRLSYGAVRDFIYYPYINVYGNLADILLGLGVIVIFIGKLSQDRGYE